jgi:predicted Rdx family selenoprotein
MRFPAFKLSLITYNIWLFSASQKTMVVKCYGPSWLLRCFKTDPETLHVFCSLGLGIYTKKSEIHFFSIVPNLQHGFSPLLTKAIRVVACSVLLRSLCQKLVSAHFMESASGFLTCKTGNVNTWLCSGSQTYERMRDVLSWLLTSFKNGRKTMYDPFSDPRTTESDTSYLVLLLKS